MMERLDLVIFGATGFTGNKVVEETIRLTEQYSALTWGVAGRSQKKLEKLMDGVSKKIRVDLSNIKLIIADVDDQESLKDMCAQARVVVNCCGPYLLYGEPVVRACLDSGTHHVDISGEVQFLESMQLQYDARARAAGVYVVGACGLDCVPTDMGVVYLQHHFDGTLNSVQSYMSLHLSSKHLWQIIRYGSVHSGTWQSFIFILANWSKLKSIRQKMYPETLPRLKPRLQSRYLHKDARGYNVSFPMADNSVVYRTQRHFYEHQNKRPVQFKAYITLPWGFLAVAVVVLLQIWYFMSQFNFTRKLLIAYPRLFSFGVVGTEGPTEDVMNNSYFETTLCGEGWSKGADIGSTPPNKKAVVKQPYR